MYKLYQGVELIKMIENDQKLTKRTKKIKKRNSKVF